MNVIDLFEILGFYSFLSDIITSEAYAFRLYSFDHPVKQLSFFGIKCQFSDNKVNCYSPQVCHVCLSGLYACGAQLQMFCTAQAIRLFYFHFCSLWMGLNLYLILWLLDVTVKVDPRSLAVHVQSVHIYAVHVIVK